MVAPFFLCHPVATVAELCTLYTAGVLCTLQGVQQCKLEHQSEGHVVNSLSFHPTSSSLITACHNQLYLWKLTAL